MNTSLKSSRSPVRKDDTTAYYQPKFYVNNSKEDIVIQVELPGVTRESLNLTIENKELILEAKASTGRPDSWKTLHRESSDHAYHLRLRLGKSVNQASIAANMADGVLALIFPKLEEAKARKISIK